MTHEEPTLSSYETPEEGEWIQPIPQGYKLQCCDCGLVHRLDFQIVSGYSGEPKTGTGLKVQFRAYRDNRATAAVRREAKKREATDGND